MNIPECISFINRRTLCCGLLFTLLSYGYAQQRTGEEVSGKPMMLYFHFDRALVDGGYMDNSRTLRHLDQLLTDRNLCVRIDSINILSFTSPDGNRAYNDRLARQRSAAVKGYLVWKYPHLNQYRIHQRPQGENWQELRRLIANDKNIPDREEVLRIIDRNKDSERCKALLKKLNGGIPYHYIYTHLLRYLRNAAVCMVWVRPERQPALPALTTLSILPHTIEKDTLTFLQPRKTMYPQGNPIAASCRQHPFLALKTNLLFDAALMPNVEIEVPVGKRWSVNGEYVFPWWQFDSGKYCMQVLMGGLEGRYWLGSRKSREDREVLTGHFLGLYAGGGKYDLQWGEKGYQGEFFIAAGVSYGWATRIARHLHLEFNIGIGLLRTDYRHYHARDNYQTLLWQENGKYTWFGPTKAKISLVWLLNRRVKKGGAR